MLSATDLIAQYLLPMCLPHRFAPEDGSTAGIRNVVLYNALQTESKDRRIFLIVLGFHFIQEAYIDVRQHPFETQTVFQQAEICFAGCAGMT
jgi:hypothetical protein